MKDLDDARWDRLQSLFHRALEVPAQERRRFLEGACGGDEQLVAEVLALVEEDTRAGLLLDRELAEIAGDVLDGSVPGVRAFGRYRVLRPLGHGGMGVVYLAERDQPRMLVAIKVLRDAALSPARRDRFDREQELLAQLEHPFIARLFDADVLPDGTPYFVMEYVDGLPLNAHCAEHRVSAEGRLALFRAACEAVQHAHRHGVIHRDLKPSNVLVGRDAATGQPVVKLLDFGIARRVEELRDSAMRTGTELRLMTPAYSAPEQFRGGVIGVHTDVYALGVMLYELLAGALPFDLSGLSPAQAESLVAREAPDPPSLRSRRAGGSPPPGAIRAPSWVELDTLCLTALHKDPRARYLSVEALIRDVDHYLRNEPLEARPPSAAYRLRKLAGRHPVVVGGSAVGTIVLVAFVLALAVQGARVARERDRANREAEASRQVSQFLIDLFRVSDPEMARGRKVTARELLDEGARKFEGELEQHPLARARLMAAVGQVYCNLGLYREAEPLLEEALDVRQRLLGAADPERVRSLYDLGQLYLQTSRYEEAEPLLVESLAAQRILGGDDDPLTLRFTGSLGTLHLRQGRYEEAEGLLAGAVGRQERDLGAAHPETLVTAGRLGALYRRLGRYDEAEALYRKSLRALAEHAPADEFGRARILGDLGVLLVARGRYDEAERTLDESIDLKTRLYGREHPEVLRMQLSLGAVYEYQKRFDLAGETYAGVLALAERVLGPDHEETIATKQNLAGILTAQKRYDEAEAAYLEAVASSRRVIGEDHPGTAQVRHNLALLYREIGRYDEAARLFEQVQRSWEGSLRPDHPHLAENLEQHARLLRLQGRNDEAQGLKTRAAVIRAKAG